MATLSTKKTFKIVDLIRKRDRFEFIEIPKFPVEVTMEVITSALIGKPKPPAPAVFDRLEEAATMELERYESVITEELEKIEEKIRKLIEQPGGEALKQAERM